MWMIDEHLCPAKFGFFFFVLRLGFFTFTLAPLQPRVLGVWYTIKMQDGRYIWLVVVVTLFSQFKVRHFKFWQVSLGGVVVRARPCGPYLLFPWLFCCCTYKYVLGMGVVVLFEFISFFFPPWRHIMNHCRNQLEVMPLLYSSWPSWIGLGLFGTVSMAFLPLRTLDTTIILSTTTITTPIKHLLGIQLLVLALLLDWSL